MAKNKIKRRVKRKTRIRIDMILLIIFSFVLFTNNLTDLFSNFGVQPQVNLIAWFGIMGSILYAFWEKF